MTEPEQEEQMAKPHSEEQRAEEPAPPPPPPGTVSQEEAADAWTLVDENGNEFVTTSAIAYHNLTAQGYTAKDPEAAAKLTAKIEERASDPDYAKAADPTTYGSSRR